MNNLYKIIILTVIVSCASIPGAIAQDVEEGFRNYDINDLTNSSIVQVKNYSTYEGSPYIFQEFLPGVIQLNGNTRTKELLINYNGYDNRVEFIRGNQVLAINTDLIAFTVEHDNGEKLFSKGYNASRLEVSDFVEVVGVGETKFLIKHGVSLIEDIASYGTATQSNKFVENKEYYIHKDGKTNRLRKLNRRRISKFIDIDSKTINEIINENSLDLSKEEDVIQFFKLIK